MKDPNDYWPGILPALDTKPAGTPLVGLDHLEGGCPLYPLNPREAQTKPAELIRVARLGHHREPRYS